MLVLHAEQGELVERGDRRAAIASLAVCAVHDELGEHRIEIGGDLLARLERVLEAQPGRRRDFEHCDDAGLGQEVALGVLGADAAFDRVAVAR